LPARRLLLVVVPVLVLICSVVVPVLLMVGCPSVGRI
jgi:hypothetical protein